MAQLRMSSCASFYARILPGHQRGVAIQLEVMYTEATAFKAELDLGSGTFPKTKDPREARSQGSGRGGHTASDLPSLKARKEASMASRELQRALITGESGNDVLED